MEGSGRHIIAAAAAAFALSGCSFFLLSYLRDRNNFSKPILPIPTCITHKNINASYSTAKEVGRKKHVRFVVGVKENESSMKKEELLKKKNKKKAGVGVGVGKSGERKERGSLPENWRNLYSGMKSYRSQQAIHVVYA